MLGMPYTHAVLTQISQTLNVIIGGHPNQSLSSRAYANRDKLFWSDLFIVIETVFFWEKDHCRKAFEVDVRFAKNILKIADEVLKEDEK